MILSVHTTMITHRFQKPNSRNVKKRTDTTTICRGKSQKTHHENWPTHIQTVKKICFRITQHCTR